MDLAALDLGMCCLLCSGSQHARYSGVEGVRTVMSRLLDRVGSIVYHPAGARLHLLAPLMERERQLLWWGGLEAAEESAEMQRKIAALLASATKGHMLEAGAQRRTRALEAAQVGRASGDWADAGWLASGTKAPCC